MCLVFEKVNTGGVPLSVFELATATYAAEGFNLRDDWFGRDAIRIVGRSQKFALQPLLKDIQSTEFLQGISLLTTYEKRCADIANGVQNIAAVSAKREHVLALTLSEYKRWADRLSDGFFVADRFLRMEGFHDPGYLPYRSQMTPLAAVMAHLGERWMEPVIRDKLTRWYWSGVLGELYSGATETRIANDLVQLLAWINEPNAKEPSAVTAAGFQSSRLDTLRSRTSAAYRGIYILIQRQGSKDFFWKAKMIEIDREECGIDLHHIFPKDWCNKNNISPSIYNSIINKTPISYKANRMIGGSAPSKYLEELRTHTQVKINLSEQDEILKSHLITPELLRSDNFFAFFSARKISMINTIAGVMGKAVSDEIDTTSDGDQEHED